MTLTDLVLIMTSNSGGVMKVATTLADTVATLFLGFLTVAFSSWAYKILTRKEEFTAEHIFAWLVVPALAYTLIVPQNFPLLAPNGEGIAIGIVEDTYKAVAYIVDKKLVPTVAEITKAPKGADFTELAQGLRDRAVKVSDQIRKEVKVELENKLSDPSQFDASYLSEHATIAGVAIAVLSGVGTGIKSVVSNFEGLSVIGKLGIAPSIITMLASGTGTGMKTLLLNLLTGYATDIVWRLVVLLWYIKASALLILAPISAFTVALEFRFGEGNIIRLLVNLLGIAITPIVLVALLSSIITAFPIAQSLASQAGGFEGVILNLFIGIAYPIIAGMVLSRAGEIVSYIIGTPLFAISSVANVYVRPLNVLHELRGG